MAHDRCQHNTHAFNGSVTGLRQHRLQAHLAVARMGKHQPSSLGAGVSVVWVGKSDKSGVKGAIAEDAAR